MTNSQALQPGTPKHSQVQGAVLEDLWVDFPQHCLVLTDGGTRPAVELGIARAQQHGFCAQGDLSAFVSLMVLLGADFDEDPQLPWARACLRTHKTAARGDAMEALLVAVADRMTPMIGPDGELYRRALAWALHHGFDEIAASSGDDRGLHEILGRMFPAKYVLLGESVVQELVLRSRVSARTHSLTAGPAVGVYLALMFLLGSGFARDPFHPWAAHSLANSTLADQTERARRLHAAGIVMIRRYAQLTRLQRIGGDERKN